MPTVETSVEVDFDLEDYEDDIVAQYCDNDNCLKQCGYQNKIGQYIRELDKDLHIYLNPSKRTLEQVCYDLMQLIKE